MTDAEKTLKLTQALLENNSSKICILEMPLHDRSWISRRADLLTIQTGKPFKTTAYEVKVSKSDLKRDSRAKQAMASALCQRFYYVTPDEPWRDLIPEWAGWQTWDGSRFIIRKRSPVTDRVEPDWRVIVSALRNSVECRRDTEDMRARLSDLRRHVKTLGGDLDRANAQLSKYIEKYGFELD